MSYTIFDTSNKAQTARSIVRANHKLSRASMCDVQHNFSSQFLRFFHQFSTHNNFYTYDHSYFETFTRRPSQFSKKKKTLIEIRRIRTTYFAGSTHSYRVFPIIWAESVALVLIHSSKEQNDHYESKEENPTVAPSF